MRPQLAGHARRETLERALHDIRQGVATTAKDHVPFGHLDDEAAAPFDHVGRGVLGGDEVRQDRLPEGVGTVGEIGLPERAPPAEQGVLAGDAVDEHVEPAVVADDAGEERFDLGLDGVIDAHGDTGAAGGGHHGGGLVDRLGTIVG